MPAAPSMRRPGFTLIELLVVISIIALLIGILLPALGAARRTARGLRCLSMIRQFGVANELYVVDFEGWYVPLEVDQDPDAGSVDKLQWYRNRIWVTYTGQDELVGATFGWKDGFICPEATLALEDGALFYAYGMNDTDVMPFGLFLTATGSDNNIRGHYQPYMSDPSSVVSMADGLDWQINGSQSKADPEWAWNDLREDAIFPAVTSGGVMAYRHSGDTANTLYFDGHAGANNADVLWNQGNNEALWKPYDNEDWWMSYFRR